MKSRRALWPSLFTVVLILSAAAVINYTDSSVVFQERVLDSRSGSPLRVVYVLPGEALSETGRTRPAVVAVPPYSVPPEAMSIICVELARRGAACAIPDFFGKAPEESRQRMGPNSLEIMTEDVRTIVYSLWSKSFKFVHRRKTGVCGHSVGGTVTYLAGRYEPMIRASVPIGMETDFFERVPQNMLFLSGLYDEIHSPRALVENLKDMELTDAPENNVLYGSFHNGTARKVTIIPTTDHFIETFDPFLIRALLDWYAVALDAPWLKGGPLEEWRRRVAAFFLMISGSVLYAIIMGRAAAAFVKRLGDRQPGWLILRLQALPVIAAALGLLMLGRTVDQVRPAAIDLMISLLLAQELVSLRARGALRHAESSPFRRLRSAFLLLSALGAGTLLSFGITCLPNYFRWPEMAAWYPVFCLNMAVLFPLEVWGRIVPWFFTDLFTALEPRNPYWLFLAVVVIAPGALARVVDRFAIEAVVTVRAGLKPTDPSRVSEDKAGHEQTRLKTVLLAVLTAVLVFLGYRRVVEGMLTWETGGLALLSLLKFAVLPFVIAWLIIRTRAFRRLSLLD
jgi:hypothetical protein